MKKSKLSAIGTVAFVFGAIAIVLAFVLLYPFFVFNQVAYIFTFVSVLLIYILFFLPMFLAPFRSDAGGIAVGGGIYYKGLSVYTFISVVNIILIFTLLPLAVSLVIQCVALFVLLLWIFMAQLAKEHIDESLQAEETKKSAVIQLRNRASKLSAMTSSLDGNNPVRIGAKRIEENMRYLSPSDTPDARELDSRLLILLDTIIRDPLVTSDAGAGSEQLKKKFDEFDVLYKERKSIL